MINLMTLKSNLTTLVKYCVVKRSLTGRVAVLVSHCLIPLERAIELTTETTSLALKTTAATRAYELTRAATLLC